MSIDYLKSNIRDIPDFPKKGIIFKDITPLLADPKAFKLAVDLIADNYKNKKVDKILGAEARGFIIGSALAYKLNAGFIPARKPGKLPSTVASVQYALEYGVDSLEMHDDAIANGQNILIVDDVLATGGTAAAKIDLIKKMGGNHIGSAFLIELSFLNGAQKLDGDIFSLIKY